MDKYVTGETIKYLREKRNMTQSELANKLFVSDKAVSKWETGKGYPDITLLQPIADIFSVSITELLSGGLIENTNKTGNMLKSNFYVCPICGNVIHSMGELSVYCHGIRLLALEPELNADNHNIFIEQVEDDYYIRIDHEMTKQHYISFIAAVSIDGVQIKKLYPEGPSETRFSKSALKKIYYYCNRDGLQIVNFNRPYERQTTRG